MRIRSHIFISVFLASVLPLIVLALAASYYSESLYQREINREISNSLNGVSTEISHELQNSRNLVLGISRAKALQDFMPILVSAAKEENHTKTQIFRDKINHYLEGFQTIIADDFAIRILDYHGDTLIKVTQNKTSHAQYESLYGMKYVEHQIQQPNFVTSFKKLPRDEVSFITLPHHSYERDNPPSRPLLDYAIPLFLRIDLNNYEWLGTLVVTLSGEQIDHILKNVTRLYKGHLFIAENNPDNVLRHALLIYDENKKLSLAQQRSLQEKLQPSLGNDILSESSQNQYGVIKQNDSLIYYAELFPYPNRLIGWIIATQIDENVITSPFSYIRMAIWLFATIALLFTLVMTGFTVRKISQPVCKLAYQLKSFADGNFEQRANQDQSIAEINVLSSSFNYMADTLVHTQSERDKAQKMALQNNKLASIGQMAAGIGHEINNPLNNILSFTTLINRNLKKNTDAVNIDKIVSIQQDIDSIRNETLRASEIIKGILNFARQMPPQLQSFSVKAWLENSILLAQQTAKSRHISIHLNYKDNDVFIGDQSQLQQVMINLLINAIQASDENTDININVNYDEDQLEIEIKDQGCGVNKDDLNNIFDPFFTTKAEGDGSGLGLSVSLGIIESHHGNLIITNNAKNNQGATATLTLPVKKI